MIHLRRLGRKPKTIRNILSFCASRSVAPKRDDRGQHVDDGSDHKSRAEHHRVDRPHTTHLTLSPASAKKFTTAALAPIASAASAEISTPRLPFAESW